MITLPAGHDSPAIARAFVDAWLRAWGLDELQERVVLATSELVSNAVIHAHLPLALEVEADLSEVMVVVGDRSERPPLRQALRAPTQPGGRGLSVVDTVADAWGSEGFDGGGKVVWCTFRTDQG